MRLLRRAVLLGMAATLVWAAAPQSLEEVEREADLEKRSRLAIEYARAAVGRMVKAYVDGGAAEARELLDSIVAAAAMSQDSLEDTGKNARSKPKHFKRAEIGTRKLVRDLEGAKRKLTFEERADLDPAIEKIEEINRQLLFDIMERKK